MYMPILVYLPITDINGHVRIPVGDKESVEHKLPCLYNCKPMQHKPENVGAEGPAVVAAVQPRLLYCAPLSDQSTPLVSEPGK